MCAICAYANYLFIEDNSETNQYIFQNSATAGVQAMKAYGSFFLMNNSFIPIDLAVGLEMGKAMYVYFLQGD